MTQHPTTRLIRREGHRRMPWKNGGGETVEIAVFPPASGLSDFGWRVSMATVASDGPFSVFPGIDRTLAVLSGDGIALDIDGMGHLALTPESPPLSFPADAPTVARLEGGPITDLNVMTRRGRFRHRLQRLDAVPSFAIAAGEEVARLLVALDPLGVSTAGGLIGMHPLDALLVEDGAAIEVIAAGERAGFHLVAIEPA